MRRNGVYLAEKYYLCTQINDKTQEDMEATERTALNKAQLDILQLLGHIKTVEQADELRQVICSYYARKVDEEMDRLWDEGKWSQAHIDALLKEDVHAKHHAEYAE